MNKISEETKSSMIQRVITALVLLFTAVPALLFGGWFFLALVAAVLALMIHEFVNAPKHRAYSLVVHIFIYIMTFSFVFWIFAKNNLNAVGTDFASWSFQNNFNTITVSTIGVAVTVFFLFFISLLHTNFRIEDVTYLFSMIVFIGISMQSILYIRYVPLYQQNIDPNFSVNFWTQSCLIIYVVIGTFFSDIGAYFVGVIFGKNKINPRISPKKTWEGFFGGVVFSFIASFLFGFLLAHYGHPMLPVLDSSHWYWILVISLIMPFMANLGDFIFSALKRHFEIKDYGTLLRGHGGVLDRFDSLLVTSLTVAILLIFISNGWNFLL